VHVDECVILAAGKGTRLDPITRNRPKPLLPLAGKPLLLWQLEFLSQVGIRKITIVKHYLGELIIKTVMKYKDILKIEVEFVDQEKPLGTAHALEVTEEFVRAPFLLMYGDITITPEVIREAIRSLEKESKIEAVAIGVEVNDPWNYGVFKLQGDRLVDLIEKPRKGTEPSNLINAGIYLFRSNMIYDFVKRTGFSPRGEKELTDSLKMLAKKYYVKVLKMSKDWWFDIGKPWDLLNANKFFLSKYGNKQVKLKKGTSKEVKIIPPVYIGDNVHIGENSVIGPFTVLCNNVEVQENSTIRNSIVLEDTRIGPNVKISNSIIGSKVVIDENVQIYSHWSDESSIWVRVKGKLVDSGCKELGAIIGDRVWIKSNTIITPGIVIMPNRVVKGGVIDEDVL